MLSVHQWSMCWSLGPLGSIYWWVVALWGQLTAGLVFKPLRTYHWRALHIPSFSLTFGFCNDHLSPPHAPHCYHLTPPEMVGSLHQMLECSKLQVLSCKRCQKANTSSIRIITMEIWEPIQISKDDVRRTTSWALHPHLELQNREEAIEKELQGLEAGEPWEGSPIVRYQEVKTAWGEGMEIVGCGGGDSFGLGSL